MDARKPLRMKKPIGILAKLLILFLCGVAYGILTAEMKWFPYAEIRGLFKRAYSILDDERGNLHFRDVDVGGRRKVSDLPGFGTGVFIAYGQSNSANYGQSGYRVKGPVFQHFHDTLYHYEDPALGGTGGNGSPWGMLGDRLIEGGQFQRVVFSVTGVGGQTLKRLAEGEYYEYFMREYHSLFKRFGKVDGILFHQGENDNVQRPGHTAYRRTFLEFVDRMRNDGILAPFYLSQTSYCKIRYGVDSSLLMLQDSLIREMPGILRGPNTDVLTSREYRLPDDCHFSALGLQRFSEMWQECISLKSED